MRRCSVRDRLIRLRACRALRWRRVALAIYLGASVFMPGLAHADDWGCQVILCLSNPGGPEQYGECVPPIEKLWNALRHGDPFPTCNFGVGGSQGTSASNTDASAAYCREDLIYWGGPEHGELLCGARGAINVDINGQLYTRVWWDANAEDRTITEFYDAGSTQGSTQAPYDPTQAGREFIERVDREESGDGGGGG
jgi:hypothetical protein